METRIGNDIILNVDPKIFGVSGVNDIESTEAIFVRDEEPNCNGCCSQFCNPTPCCNGGCNYYNASPVNIYGMPTHCPPPMRFLYVDKIYSLNKDTKTITYIYPGNKQTKCGLFRIIIRAVLKSGKISTIESDQFVRLVQSGISEKIQINISSSITGGSTTPDSSVKGINLSYFSNKLTIALTDGEQDVSDTLTIPEATTTDNGLMSADDKNKVNTLFKNDKYQMSIQDDYLIMTDKNTGTSYKIAISETDVPTPPTSDKYNIYVGFGKESMSLQSDIESLSNSVHYVLEDVSDPNTDDGAYHIISTQDNIKNDPGDNDCYIWVCSQQQFKRLTSNGFVMPSENTIQIEGYYCKRVTNPIMTTGDNQIEIIK